ncbi:hypothetical protein [Nostoc sp.]|uniref:hypothetical protein n=1 Tax=Nostoc sp. TaxID=1180 RepID=UPI002FF5D1B1
MKSAEFQVLSAELKDRPQGTRYQPSPNKKIPPRHLLLLARSQDPSGDASGTPRANGSPPSTGTAKTGAASPQWLHKGWGKYLRAKVLSIQLQNSALNTQH